MCFFSGNRKRCRQTGSRQSTPNRRYGPDTEIQHRLREPHGLAKTSRILSKREADTEFQYRPRIVDTDTDCGRHFCGRHFRDSYFLLFRIALTFHSERSSGEVAEELWGSSGKSGRVLEAPGKSDSLAVKKILTSQNPPNLEKFKVTRKWLKSDFWGLPKVPKSHFLTQKSHFWVTFRVEKWLLGLLLRLLWGRPQKSLFSHFRVTLNFQGLGTFGMSGFS